jgi:peptide/nickel transport system ATP-binding protein
VSAETAGQAGRAAQLAGQASSAGQLAGEYGEARRAREQGWATAVDDVVLRATGVCVEYAGPRPTRAVRDVTIELRRGEVLGIAGESGCGKSTLAYALTRMLRPPAELTGGSITFFPAGGDAVDIMALNSADLRALRWNKISMVFQSAMNALNPVASLATQFDDIFRAHRPEMGRRARHARSRELLDMVGIDPGRVHGYAHELSGGMRQRVVIAMALALEPEIVIMDEPTTALDVVVQREILDEIERLREELGFSVIFITHDLSLLLEISDRLAVMYAGETIEYAPSEKVGTDPAHPYTLGLLRSFPDMRGARRELRGVPGTPPDLRDDFPGCPFQPRCEYGFGPCLDVHPALQRLAGQPGGTGYDDAAGHDGTLQDGAAGTDGWSVACHLHNPDYRPQGPPPELDGRAAGGTPAVTADAAGGEQ